MDPQRFTPRSWGSPGCFLTFPADRFPAPAARFLGLPARFLFMLSSSYYQIVLDPRSSLG